MITTFKELTELLKKNNVIFFPGESNIQKRFNDSYTNDISFKSEPFELFMYVDGFKTNIFNICDQLLIFYGDYYKCGDDGIAFQYYLSDVDQQITIIIRKYYDTYNKRNKYNKIDKLIEAIQLLPVTNISGSEYKKAENDFIELNKSSKKLN